MENLPAKQQTQSTQLTISLQRDELLSAKQYQALTTIEKEIALCSLERKIKDIPYLEFTEKMIVLIAKTYTSTGGKYSENKDQVAATIDELATDLQKYNGTLSFSELEIAFKNGWKKQTTEFSEWEKSEHFQKYGKTKDDYFGLNNATYFTWVNAYAHGVNRLNAKKAIQAAKEKAVSVPELSEDEKAKIMRDGAILCFENYKRTGVVVDINNVNYRYLWKKGLINHSEEVRKKMLQDVTERLRAEEKAKLVDPAYFGQHSSIKDELEKIGAGNSDKLIREGKRESLRLYFKNLIEMDINLTDEL